MPLKRLSLLETNIHKTENQIEICYQKQNYRVLVVRLVIADMSHSSFRAKPPKDRRLLPRVSASAELKSLCPFITDVFPCLVSHKLFISSRQDHIVYKHAHTWSLPAWPPGPSPRPSDFQSVQGWFFLYPLQKNYLLLLFLLGPISS